MATFSVNDQARRAVATANGSNDSFSFSFQVNATTDVKVYVDGTLKTAGSHYNIVNSSAAAGLNTDGTGVAKFTGGNVPANNAIVTILSDVPVARTSVYTAGGNITATSLEADLDTLTMVVGDREERDGRALTAPVNDAADVDMTLPAKDTRKGTVLGFNATSGNPEAGPTIADVSSLSAITADIAALADIEDGTTATDAISGLAAIKTNVTTVAGISGNVTTVAGITSNISSVVSNASNINTVAGAITNVNNVGGSISNVNTVAGAISNVNALAASAVIADMALLGNADVIADMALLATTDVIADMNTLATSDIVSDLNTLATSDIVSDINTLATSDIVSDLNTLATSDIVSDINTLATSDIVTDLNLLATSDIVSDLNTLATSDFVSDLNAVQAIASNVTSVAGNASNINSAVSNASNINTVAGAITNVNNVGGSIANVNTVATNISGVNSFAERYRVLSSDPSSNNDEGDLVYNTTDNNLKFFNGSSFVAVGGAISNIVEDTTPQLGGDLQSNGNDIVFADNDKAIFGAGNDLRIYHNGATSFIEDIGTGNFLITTNGNNIQLMKDQSEQMLVAKPDDAVELYYDNVKKLETTSTGVSVTGTTEASLFQVGSGQYFDTSGGNVRINNINNADILFRLGASGGEKMRLTSNAELGIGTSSPNSFNANARNLVVGTGSGSNGITIFAGNTSDSAIFFADNGSTATGQINYKHADNAFTFHTNGGTERMRISDDDILFGTTSTSLSDAGIKFANTSATHKYAVFTHTASSANESLVYVNRQSSDGTLIEFRRANATSGTIGTISGDIFIANAVDVGLYLESTTTDHIAPCNALGAKRDDAIDLGASSARFDDVFATNGTIQTSDENEKQNIAALTSAEITAAKAISKLFKTFKWKSKVTAKEEKGETARTHTGVIAQEVQTAMSDAGLDASKYAFWCSDTWTNDDGNQQTRMGVRYPELLAFVGAATEQRLADIEKRLTALESS